MMGVVIEGVVGVLIVVVIVVVVVVVVVVAVAVVPVFTLIASLTIPLSPFLPCPPSLRYLLRLIIITNPPHHAKKALYSSPISSTTM